MCLDLHIVQVTSLLHFIVPVVFPGDADVCFNSKSTWGSNKQFQQENVTESPVSVNNYLSASAGALK